MLVLVLAPPLTAPARGQERDPWWGPDKGLHFSISAGLAAAGYGGAALAGDSRPVRLTVGGAVALSAGIAKEAIDLTGRGDPSWRDLAWDVLGTATGLLVAWAIDRLWSAPARPAPAS